MNPKIFDLWSLIPNCMAIRFKVINIISSIIPTNDQVTMVQKCTNIFDTVVNHNNLAIHMYQLATEVLKQHYKQLRFVDEETVLICPNDLNNS